MTEQPSESTLAARLEDLDSRLRLAGARIADHWRPGADRTRVDEAFRSVGLEAPDEVANWFGWHDGTDAIAPGAPVMSKPENLLFGSLLTMTLEQAKSLRTEHWALLRESGWPLITRAESWFPLLILDETSMLWCVDCAGEGSVLAPMCILDPWADETSGPDVSFPSIASFVAAAVQLFDEGLARPNPDKPGVVEVDRSRVSGFW